MQSPVPGASCAHTSECPSGLECRFERCRADCVENRDCSIGSRCLRLADGAGVCGVDEDRGCETGVGVRCPDGLVCVADRCERACATAGDCPSDGECVRLAAGGPFCADGRIARPDAGVPDAGGMDAGGTHPPAEQAIFSFTDVTDARSFGAGVALSADGAFAIVGAPESRAGSARIYARSGSTWSEQATLVASDPVVGMGCRRTWRSAEF